MRKIIYYGSLIVLWLLVVMLLAVFLLMIGVFPYVTDFAYSFGGACAHPQLWVISIGIILFVRPVLYKLVMKEQRRYGKTMAILLVVAGTIWLAMNVMGRMLHEDNMRRMERYMIERGELQ